MPLCRIIYRLDYKVNFEVFNQTGKIMKILDEAGEDFWTDYIDAPPSRSIGGKCNIESDGISRTLTMSPTSLDTNLEVHNGIAIKDLENDRTFNKIVAATNNLRKEFKINDLGRCGLRFFYFEKLEVPENGVNLAFQKLVDNSMIESTKSILGSITDIGLAINGKGEDKIEYHLRSGSYYKHEANKYINYRPKKFNLTNDFNFIADIDLFENNFRLSADVSFIKWCKPLFKKAQQLTEKIESLIIENTGESHGNTERKTGK